MSIGIKIAWPLRWKQTIATHSSCRTGGPLGHCAGIGSETGLFGANLGTNNGLSRASHSKSNWLMGNANKDRE